MAASTSSASLYAFDIMVLDGDDLRRLPLSMRKTNLARLLVRRPDGIFAAPFEQGEIGPDLFRAARCGSMRFARPRFRPRQPPPWAKCHFRSPISLPSRFCCSRT